MTCRKQLTTTVYIPIQPFFAIFALGMSVIVTIVADLMTDRFLSNAIRRGLSQNLLLRRPSGLPISLSILGVSVTMPTTFLAAEPGVTIVSFVLVIAFTLMFAIALFFWNQVLEDNRGRRASRNRRLCYVFSFSPFVLGLLWTIVIGILKMLAIQIT